jgi:secondary thiamine-phosphate synthase enzyme
VEIRRVIHGIGGSFSIWGRYLNLATEGGAITTVMVTHKASRSCITRETYDFVDNTDDVQDAVAEAGITRGRATVFSPTDTCPIVVNERESGLLKDIRRAVERVEQHGDKPTAIGSKSVVLPVVEGRLRLGRWQRLLLFELGNPDEHPLIVQVVGE